MEEERFIKVPFDFQLCKTLTEKGHKYILIDQDGCEVKNCLVGNDGTWTHKYVEEDKLVTCLITDEKATITLSQCFIAVNEEDVIRNNDMRFCSSANLIMVYIQKECVCLIGGKEILFCNDPSFPNFFIIDTIAAASCQATVDQKHYALEAIQKRKNDKASELLKQLIVSVDNHKDTMNIPFNIYLAKKIANGEVDGRIVTDNGNVVRIVCFDMLDYRGSIIGLIKEDNNKEIAFTFNDSGYCVQNPSRKLMLEIPEYMTFKDGDILICECGTPFVYKDTKDRHGNFSAYCAIDLQGNIFFDMKGWTHSIKGHANEEQKKNIIEALKTSKDPKAKEYLKRFFNIEQKQEYEFKPFDKVLVRDDEGVWFAGIFLTYAKMESFYVQVVAYGSSAYLTKETNICLELLIIFKYYVI